MPKGVKTESAHFGQGLLGRPMVEGQAIGGHKNTGAIFAEFTMNEDSPARRPTEEREELRELSGSWIGEPSHGNRNKFEAERFGASVFRFAGERRFVAQIDDGGDPKSLELAEIGKMRLSATKKLVGNSSSVADTGEGEFLGRSRRRGSRTRTALPKGNGARAKRDGENEEERKKLHRELARKSLGGRERREKKKKRRISLATAPQDMGVARKS